MLKIPGQSVWIAFQYEKIPNFCFKCGIIRHGAAGCLKSGGRRFPGNEEGQQFGTWLRALSPKRWNGVGRSRTSNDPDTHSARTSRTEEGFPPCSADRRSGEVSGGGFSGAKRVVFNVDHGCSGGVTITKGSFPFGASEDAPVQAKMGGVIQGDQDPHLRVERCSSPLDDLLGGGDFGARGGSPRISNQPLLEQIRQGDPVLFRKALPI
ncbi:hypothetical protein SLA2020_280660 [Shorea laevis]